MPRRYVSGGVVTKPITAGALGLAVVVFAWQAGAALKEMALSASARMSSVQHDPGGASTMLPGVIILNVNGGRFRCTLDGTGYVCSVPPLPDAVRGAR